MRFNDKNMQSGTIGKSNFTFSGVRVERLGASEYTLVTIAVDVTGSVRGYEQDLKNCLITAIESCKKSPRSDNLLVRIITFSTSLSGGIEEIHGFKPLADINTADYSDFQPGGGTPLFDASYSAVGATNSYAETLYNDDFLVNAITIIITDGDDTSSVMTASKVREEIERGLKGEFIESNLVILVGINVGSCKGFLDNFQKDAKIDKFIDAGSVSAGKLAKLAEFVSRSVSSQSQSLGTGGPSQQISNVI